MAQTAFPARVMRRFVETLAADLRHDMLTAVLSKSGLPEELTLAAHLGALDAQQCEFKIVIGG